MDFDKLPPFVQYVAGIIVLAATAGAWIFARLRAKQPAKNGDDDGGELRRVQRELDDANLRNVLQEQRNDLWNSIQKGEQRRVDEFRELERAVAALKLDVGVNASRIAALESRLAALEQRRPRGAER